jgi:integrase
MRHASYVFLRRDTGSYFFRWTIPASVRPLLGGRAELKRSLHTDERRTALRLARRLSVMLERTTAQLMAAQLSQQDSPASYLTIKLLERLVDGSIRMEGVELDPKHAEQDQQLLSALLGPAATPVKRGTEQSLADLVKAYMEDGERAKRHTQKTRQELDSIFALMLEVLGAGKPLGELGRRDFAYLKEMLGKLPSNRRKNPLYRSKGVLELAGMPIPSSHLMSTTTINKILGWVASLMGWGHLHGYVSANFAEGLALAKSKRDDEYREPYTDEEARMLRDALLAGKYGSDGHPWRKWIPLLLMYQGMRVNEAAQLALSDFGEIDGVPVVTVTDEEGRRVKTAAARRTIPIHPELVRLGLLDHINTLRKRGGVVRAWPELSQGRDGHGQAVSRWFARFREKSGFGKDLHSARHSVVNRLRDADVPEDLIADLVGHSRSSKVTFGTYAKAATVRRMADALKRLDYGKADTMPLRLAA